MSAHEQLNAVLAVCWFFSHIRTGHRLCSAGLLQTAVPGLIVNIACILHLLLFACLLVVVVYLRVRAHCPSGLSSLEPLRCHVWL